MDRVVKSHQVTRVSVVKDKVVTGDGCARSDPLRDALHLRCRGMRVYRCSVLTAGRITRHPDLFGRRSAVVYECVGDRRSIVRAAVAGTRCRPTRTRSRPRG
jgi:hypothetical protein